MSLSRGGKFRRAIFVYLEGWIPRMPLLWIKFLRLWGKSKKNG